MFEMNELGAPRIRYNNGPMPPDHNGDHATGREVLWRNSDGSMLWVTEYESDWTWTEDWEPTDPAVEEETEFEYSDDGFTIKKAEEAEKW